MLRTILDITHTSPSFPTALQYQRGYGSQTVSSHERLKIGDVVQVLVKQNSSTTRIIEPSSDGSGAVSFFVIGGLVAFGPNSLWLVVRRCELYGASGSETAQLPNYNQPLLTSITIPPFQRDELRLSRTLAPVSYLQVDHRVRKTGLLHNCKEDGGCTFNKTSGTATHSRSTLSGGSFFVLSRSSAYPPRRS